MISICWAPEGMEPIISLAMTHSLVTPNGNPLTGNRIDFMKVTCRTDTSSPSDLPTPHPTPSDYCSSLSPLGQSIPSKSWPWVSSCDLLWPMECRQKWGWVSPKLGFQDHHMFSFPLLLPSAMKMTAPYGYCLLGCVLEWETCGARLNPRPTQPSLDPTTLHTFWARR